ncbi:MAG: rod-binding protein [Spirochaeta sp.]|jgi:flagellar protein FlgJ|nr:rod-binding protein [Spirochaeta sp.]
MDGGMSMTNSSANLAQLQLQNLRYELPQGTAEDQLRSVAEDFEAIFVKQMLESMRSTLNPEHRLVDTGMAGEMFEDMLYDEYAQTMSKSGGFGLADMIVNQYRA